MRRGTFHGIAVSARLINITALSRYPESVRQRVTGDAPAFANTFSGTLLKYSVPVQPENPERPYE